MIVSKDGIKLYEELERYFCFYNTECLNRSLDYETPESLYKKAAWVINKLILINKKGKEAKKGNFKS